jgi:hypothetical protein
MSQLREDMEDLLESFKPSAKDVWWIWGPEYRCKKTRTRLFGLRMKRGQPSTSGKCVDLSSLPDTELAVLHRDGKALFKSKTRAK